MGRAILSVKVAAGTNNIPTSFDTTAGSRVATGLANKGYTHAMIVNETAGRISVVLNGDSVVPPASGSTAKAFVLPTAVATFDDVTIGDAIYIQSDTGSAISAASVEIMVW